MAKFKHAKVVCDGRSLEPLPVKDSRQALQAVLSMTLAHTAEVFEAFATAIAEHYTIDRDEMFAVIQSHPAWTSIQTHPVLKDLGYLEPESEPKPKPKPKKKFIIKPSPANSIA